MNIDRLKESRENKDYQQTDIAKYIKVTQVQYCRYEMGINTITIEKLASLAKFYDTSIDYLVGLTDERKPYSKR